jgi:hypothetical protein
MRWMILGVTCLLGACASQPKSDTAPVPAPVQAAPAASANTSNTSGIVTEEEFAREAKSYKLVEKDGKSLYCRTEQVLGSRLPSTVCLTHAQLTDSISRTRELTDKMRQKGGGHCGGGTPCN